jgi:membrane associated rhomboid family serine protease
MFPLNDTEPNRYSRFPLVTILLIVINSFIFFGERFIVGDSYWVFLMKYATTPCLVLTAQDGGALSTITTMFLHIDLFHLVFNMLPLWVFGRRVEDACGSWRFLVFYLLTGTWANILSVAVQFDSCIPSIGASGAIFGLMGAYLLLYPGGRIRTLILIGVIPFWPRIRAIWIALYFLGGQILPAFQILFRRADYNINYWAHLGGFLSAITVLLFLRRAAYARYRSNAQM